MEHGSTRGAVAAGHRLTAQAGADVLAAGGNAFDAAVAAMAMACVAEPVLCSPGGGGFAMVRHGDTGEVALIDFFPQTPMERRRPNGDGVHEIHADFGTATQAFHIGPATVATPGFFAGLEVIAETGGTLTLPTLLGPAARAAREGVTLTPFQHHLFTVVAPILTATEAARRLYAPEGHLLKPGDRFLNPGLGDALEAVGAGTGGGDISAALVAAQREAGHLTNADIDNYRVAVRAPLRTETGDAAVHLNPLPAAGGVLIAHSLAAISSSRPLDLAEAFMATGRVRAAAPGSLGLLGEEVLRRRGTTHVSVIDNDGNACAVTISNGEGNGEILEPYGIMPNNILGEDDVNPGGPTGWPTDTRLSSMMCPTILEWPDGRLVALGTGGSNRIRTAIPQVLVRLCAEGADLATAIRAPRLHVEGSRLDFENLYDEPDRESLCSTFNEHRAWPERNLFFGGVHAVEREPAGRLVGAGDPRRDGITMTV